MSTNPQRAPKSPSSIAREALKKLQEIAYNDGRRSYDLLCEEFVEYLENCEETGFLLSGYDTKKGKQVRVPGEYLNRWTPGRRMELSKKLNRLEYWFELQEDRPVTMITFTGYHTGYSIGNVFERITCSRRLILKLIHKYFGNVDYFWVWEPHPGKDTGYPHVHLAIFADVSNHHEWWTHQHGIDWYRGEVNLEDKFRELYSKKYVTGSHTYGLDFSQKKGDNKIKSLKNYLVKYLEKGFLLKEWSVGTLLFNVHLWAGRYRMYGASKNISAIMKDPEQKCKNVVWLETKIETADSGDKIVYHREYIPGWIDSSLWSEGIEPNDSIKLYDCWGRSHAGNVRRSYCVEAFKKNGSAGRTRKTLLKRRDERQEPLCRYGIAIGGYGS